MIPTAEECRPCHAEVVAAWEGSGHASSATGPLFTASLRDAVLPRWCVSCHAPTGRRDEGVGCAICHVGPDGVILTADEDPDGAWAHPLRTVTVGCGACHEFALPPEHPSASEVPVQDTVGEWAALGAVHGGRSCADCHLPDGRHDLPGAHDPAFVAGAVDVTVGVEDGAVLATLAAPGAGHAVPTGDPFRRLELQLCPDPDCAVVLARRAFGRRFGGPAWHLVDDTALRPGRPVRVVLPLPAGATAWRLWYQLAEDRIADQVAPEDLGYVVEGGPLGP